MLSSTFTIYIFEAPGASPPPHQKFEDQSESALSPALSECTQVSAGRPHLPHPPLLGRPWLEKSLPTVSASLKFCFFPSNHLYHLTIIRALVENL